MYQVVRNLLKRLLHTKETSQSQPFLVNDSLASFEAPNYSSVLEVRALDMKTS